MLSPTWVRLRSSHGTRPTDGSGMCISEVPFVDVETAAARLACTEDRVCEAMNAGDLPCCRVAGRWLVPEIAVTDLLEDSAVSPGS